MPKSDLIKVEVITDPGCGPPDWVRRSWLGVEFDATPVCSPDSSYYDSSPERKPIEPAPFWEVETAIAIEALRQYDREKAAAWWEEYREEHKESEGGDLVTLAFPINSCRPVDGSVIVFPDLN